MKRLLRLDWDAVAGIIAAVLALVLHFLHVVEEEVLLVIALVLLALLFVRDLRGEQVVQEMAEDLGRLRGSLRDLSAGLRPPDAVLVGPHDLRTESAAFVGSARGDVLFFHVCLLMFRSRELFDVLLRPAVESPEVESVEFVLDPAQRELWDEHVAPKLETCEGREKVREPRWVPIDENVSFITAETAEADGPACLLSFWGEPFMSRTVDREVPRYIFRIPPHSELVSRLVELARRHRMAARRSGEEEASP